jgi:hypothetical protein
MFGKATDKVLASGTITIGGCFDSDAAVCPHWFVSENVQLLANEIRVLPTTGVNALSMHVLNMYLKSEYDDAFTTFALIYSLWDGIGFRENAAMIKENFFTRANAFFLYIQKATGYPVPIRELDKMEHYMWNAQVSDAYRGMKASYNFNGVAEVENAPSSTETNSQVLLNYDQRIATWFPLKRQGLRPTPAPTTPVPTKASGRDGSCVVEFSVRYGVSNALNDLGCTASTAATAQTCCDSCSSMGTCASWSLSPPNVTGDGASQCCLSGWWRKDVTAALGFVSGYTHANIWKVIPPSLQGSVELQLDAKNASWAGLADGSNITSDWIATGARTLPFEPEGLPTVTRTPSGSAAAAFDGTSSFGQKVCSDCTRKFFNLGEDLGNNHPMTIFVVLRPRSFPANCLTDPTPNFARFMGHNANGQFRFYMCKPSVYMGKNMFVSTAKESKENEWMVLAYRNHPTGNVKRVDIGSDKGMEIQWAYKNQAFKFSANRKLYVGSTKSTASDRKSVV